MKVGIIGAGLSGLSCAEALHAQGHDVALIDKSRGAGGRMSTRRIATPAGEAVFDHGAQYFTVRDAGFAQVVDTWATRGLAGRWSPAGQHAWVGIPAMNAIGKDIAARHETHYAAHVQGIIRVGGGWRLMGEAVPTDTFDALVVAIPAEQAATLIGAHDLTMARHALVARSQPCWAGMFAFADRLDTDTIVVRDEGLIGWAARNGDKPGRAGPEAWIVQASSAWSSAHIEASREDVQTALYDALAEALSIAIPAPIAATAHRWRFALSAGTGEGRCGTPDLRLGVCGDWLLGPRVECAWLSGAALARRMTA